MRIGISERQQVVLVFAAAAAVVLLLWFLKIRPQNERRRTLEREIAQMRNTLARGNYLLGEEPLRQQKAAEEQTYQELREWWRGLTAQYDTFADEPGLTNVTVRHIEYKQALFEVVESLRKKSESMGIRMPSDLGLADTLQSNEDARTRMLQLRAEEKILDLLLDLKIPMIRAAEPLAPVPHTTATGVLFCEEYPVQVSFQGGLGGVYEMLNALLAKGRPFVIRRWRIQKAPGGSDRVDVSTVISALVFHRGAEEAVPVVERPAAPMGPMGY